MEPPSLGWPICVMAFWAGHHDYTWVKRSHVSILAGMRVVLCWLGNEIPFAEIG